MFARGLLSCQEVGRLVKGCPCYLAFSSLTGGLWGLAGVSQMSPWPFGTHYISTPQLGL